jgi:peroxiredoxin
MKFWEMKFWETLWLRAAVWTAVYSLALPVCSQSPGAPDPYADLVPQNLLRLVHAPEVHQELGLSPEQIAKLESFFEQYDGPWFRSRILPADKQRTLVHEIEAKFRQNFAQLATEPQRQRLQQLEYRSLGIRMLLRADVGRQLGLDESQRDALASLARATNAAVAKAQAASQSGSVSEELKTAATEAAAAEQSALTGLLRSEQQSSLGKLLGDPFDTTRLERIYPMAPELVNVEHWLNTQPLQLKELRGKVVVVHFYAFQCHNCHANFEHYNKWHDEFSTDHVVVLGIQTPETSAERDPAAVTAAAQERGFHFPVLIDLKSENWKAWANTMWPTVYVIDKRGYLRFWWQGELNWQGATHDQTLHKVIEKLIAEEGA